MLIDAKVYRTNTRLLETVYILKSLNYLTFTKKFKEHKILELWEITCFDDGCIFCLPRKSAWWAKICKIFILWRDNKYSTKKYILTLISAKHFRANSYPTYSAYPAYGNASLYILNLTMNKTTNLKYLSRLGATGFAAATFCLFIATVSSGKLHFISIFKNT